MNKYTVLTSAVVLWCVGCVTEKVVCVRDSDIAAVSRVSCRCDARIVRVLGLSNDYFRDTEFFKSGKIMTRSAEVELSEPFGPFNRATCSLTTRTPNVVDVTTEDRSNATNTLSRYFMEEIALKREFNGETTAEELEKEVEKLVTQLNGIFGCQLVPPVIFPVIEAGEKGGNQTDAQSPLLRRPLLGGLRRPYAAEGATPVLTVSIELRGQRVYIAAYEPVFCKRKGVMKLKSPAKLFMTISMNSWINMSSDDEQADVKPITMGGDNLKAFFGAFSTSEYGGSRISSRSPAQYEYNLDTKRIKRSFDNEQQGEIERRQREAERSEQRRQLLAIQDELRRVREARSAAANGEDENNSATNKPGLRRQGLLGGGTLRARRLQRLQEAEAAAAKQREGLKAKDTERQEPAEQENAPAAKDEKK